MRKPAQTCALVIVFLIMATCAEASVLSDAVAALQSGHWLDITSMTNGWWQNQSQGVSLMNCQANGAVGGDTIASYSNTATWDPSTHEFYYFGGNHTDQSGIVSRFMKYTESTSAWKTLFQTCPTFFGFPFNPALGGSSQHGYNYNALDTMRHVFYYQTSVPADFPALTQPVGPHWITFSIESQSWTGIIPNAPAMIGAGIGGIAYFPDIDRIVIVQANDGRCRNPVTGQLGAGLYMYNPGNRRYEDAGGGGTGIRYTDRNGNCLDFAGDNFVHYDPAHHQIYFGGAYYGPRLYTMDSSLVITRRADPPADMGAGTESDEYADGVTGDLITVFNWGDMFRYNLESDSWSRLQTASQIPFAGASAPSQTVVVSLAPTYPDTAMWIGGETTNASVKLYKYGRNNLDNLVFTTQPTGIVSGGTFPSPVVVAAKLPGTNTTDTSFSGSVTLTLSTSPVCGSSSTGTLTQTAVNGVATFPGLGAVNATVSFCDYYVTASGTNNGLSNSFKVLAGSCSTPAKLLFTGQPSNATVGGNLGTVSVGVYDASNVLCSTDTSSVTLAAHTGSTTSTLQSSSNLTKAAVNGVATWSDLFVSPTSGSISIDATDGALTGTTSNAITITSSSTTTSGPPPTPSGSPTFATKCTQPGVLACWPFDSQSELTYNWPAYPIANTAMSAFFAAHPGSDTTNRGFDDSHTAGQANTTAKLQVLSVEGTDPNHGGTPNIFPAFIDNAVSFEGGGSLKFTVPTHSSSDCCGMFRDNINKILGNPSVYIAPGTPSGNRVGDTLWVQFKYRVNDVMTNVSTSSGFLNGIQGNAGTSASVLSTPAGCSGSPGPYPIYYDPVDTGAFGRFTGRVGTYATIFQGGGSLVNNFHNGIYTITGVFSDHFTIDRCATPDGPGDHGMTNTSGQPLNHQYYNPYKILVTYGNTPNQTGSGGGPAETTLTNAGTAGPYLDIYSVCGSTETPTQQVTNPFIANTWHEITIKIQTLTPSPNPFCGTYNTIATVWMDGVQLYSFSYHLDLGDSGNPQGIGQFYLSPFITGKDDTQDHPTGYIWYDDLITSTQPIAMGGSSPAPNPVSVTVSITAPNAGATVNGISVPVTASASGAVGVQFKLDGANLGSEQTTAPYSIIWDTTKASNGSHTITAVGRDSSGNQTTSSGVTVTVNNIALPSVSISAPSNGATVSGTSVTVTATASSTLGIAGVQFTLDGTNLGSQKTTAPYSITWDTTQVVNGSHFLTAVALDTSGNHATSAAAFVTVSNNSTTTVSITAPASGATVNGTAVAISANASNAGGIAGVQFLLDGVSLGAERTTVPYSMTWNTTQIANGVHLLTAVARDAVGNLTTSAAVTITVSNISPTISITSPANNATVGGSAVSILATASNIVGVQFKVDGANLGPLQTGGPYTIMWDATQVSNGAHTLSAVAVDSAGNQTTSSIVVNVNNAVPSYKPTNSVPYSLSDRGTDLLTDTAKSSSISVGYARVQTSSGSSALGGSAIFSYQSNGAVVSETSVPLSPLVQSGRMYVEQRGPVSTGIAFANPNNQVAVISFNFTDSNGLDFGSDSFTLGPNQQMAKFLSEPPFTFPNNMEGTFTFSSSIPISMVALRGLTNERNIFLMSTVPVPTLAATNATPLGILPHFAIGAGWTTKLVLVNQTDNVLSGYAQFFSPASGTDAVSPLIVTVNGIAMSGLNYSIPAHSVFAVTLDSVDGNLAAGSIRIMASNGSVAPTGQAIFSFTNNGVIVSEASVPIVAPATALRVYVESQGAAGTIGSSQTGIALANPTSSAAVVNLDLTQADGTPAATTVSVVIPPGGQVAKFLKELIPSVPDTFSGVLRVSSANPITGIGLHLTANAGGDYLMSTFPVVTETLDGTPQQLLFPHVVSGAGFTTELILLDRQPSSTSSGQVIFSAQDGSPLSMQ